ncbi:transcriptional regulator, CarD family [Ruminococcaceae bacterium KH2T8]|nr:transcriptional regulator, CarD family [Ruminococcaceae bacterium KH2T8]
MYTVGDTVVYGGSGVCEIDDIRDISFYHERPKKYYVLKPMFVKQSSTVYVPFDNEKLTAKIQPVISKDEAIELIDGIGSEESEWIDDRNQRKDHFNDLLSNGTRKQIINLISMITKHRDTLAGEGKVLNMQDEKILAEAERRMNAEFAVALDMRPDEVVEYISDRMSAC